MQESQCNSPESNLPESLASPARRALAGAGIECLEQLAEFRQAQLEQLRQALHSQG